jgi:hypothetical protein
MFIIGWLIIGCLWTVLCIFIGIRLNYTLKYFAFFVGIFVNVIFWPISIIKTLYDWKKGRIKKNLVT